MKTTVFVALAALAGATFAQQPSASEAAPRKVAVFVQNRARAIGMDDEVDGVRDRLAAALSGVDGISVVDSAQVADTFRRNKIDVSKDGSDAGPGIFSGGSVPRIAQMLGCDYVVVATIVNASAMNRSMGERVNTVFTLRMSLRILDSSGASVDGLPMWTRQMPVVDADGVPMTYYQVLFDQWADEVASAVAQKATKWRAPVAAAGTVEFSVSTTIDQVFAELESRTKGVSGEQLQELRRVVGGVTVELDGAVVGSAPGPFRATPGLHQIKVSREWMKPYFATVNIQPGMTLNVALEMSAAGLDKWGSMESLRAEVARSYADAARERGVEVKIDTTNWRDVGSSGLHIIKETAK